jgi:serine/threonine protein kinase
MKKNGTAAKKKELRSLAQRKLGALVSTEDPGEIYTLKTLLGKGSFGYVYHATHHLTQQVCNGEQFVSHLLASGSENNKPVGRVSN